jgi:hypothetical protein
VKFINIQNYPSSMRLDEYLKQLETCEDPERLQKDLGIYDNRSVLLSVNFDEFVADLLNQRFKIHKADGNEGRINHLIDFIPGTVRMKVCNRVSPYDTIGFGFGNTEEEARESGRQLEEYNVSVCLHPYQEQKIPDTDWRVAVAQVALDLGKYAMRKGISICFSHVKPPVEYKPAE